MAVPYKGEKDFFPIFPGFFYFNMSGPPIQPLILRPRHPPPNYKGLWGSKGGPASVGRMPFPIFRFSFPFFLKTPPRAFLPWSHQSCGRDPPPSIPMITLLFILGSCALGIYYLLCKPRHFYLNVKVLSAEGAIRQKMKVLGVIPKCFRKKEGKSRNPHFYLHFFHVLAIFGDPFFLLNNAKSRFHFYSRTFSPCFPNVRLCEFNIIRFDVIQGSIGALLMFRV